MVFLAVIAGCARPTSRPPVRVPGEGTATPSLEGRRYYESLRDSLPQVPDDALRDRIIVIDPGHGGRWDGVVGAGGLREADVNLAVALDLEALLAAAGARVYLTRRTDRDLAAPDSSLRADLMQRAQIGDSLAPDLFLSLHHNSTLPVDRKRDTSDIFFRLDDNGASLDAARHIHRALVRNLGLPPGRFSAANYFVLRESDGPAVLVEASYLSNPAIEARLRTAEGIRLEAQAYFLGLGAYFGAGIPVLEYVTTPEDSLRDPLTSFAFAVIDSAGGLDPASAEAWFDARSNPRGVSARIELDPMQNRLWVRPGAPLRAGTHTLDVRVRNVAGNTSRGGHLTFDVASPPAVLALDATPPGLPVYGDPVCRITARLRDRHGNPVADGTRIIVRVDGGAPLVPLDSIPLSREGAILFHVAPAVKSSALHIHAETPGAGGQTVRAMLDIPRTRDTGLLWGRVRFTGNGDTSRVVGDATIGIDAIEATPVPVTVPVPSDEAGYYFIPIADSGAMRPTLRSWTRAPGFETRTDTVTVTRGSAIRQDIDLHAMTEGRLRGLRVVIDPAGGGDDQGQVSAEGYRGKDLNLRLAHVLEVALAGAGAEVELTRRTDQSASEAERVQAAERAAPELVLCLDTRAGLSAGDFATIGHYPGSRAGQTLAESIAVALRALDAGEVRVEDVATFTVQQVRAPAVEVTLHALDTAHEASFAWDTRPLARVALAIRNGFEKARGAGAPGGAGSGKGVDPPAPR